MNRDSGSAADHALLVRGSNHEGMRQFNERIVLQAIRLHGALPKAELARLTQLSKQTVSVIVERLLDDGLLLKQDRIRGGIGQPSVPLALNPDGAYSVGVQVGRRSLEVLMANFLGQIVQHDTFRYDYPDPDHVLPTMKKALVALESDMAPRWPRVVGAGLAAPLGLDQWADVLGPHSATALARWQGVDVHAALQAMTPLPVVFARDTVAACTAELLLGHGQQLSSFLYVYVASFVGGGLVIQGRLLTGDRDNAGAIGSMPVGLAPTGGASQLLEVASGWVLGRTLQAAGLDPQIVLHDAVMDPRYADWVQPWLDHAANALAMVATASTALLDLDAIVLDGSLSHRLLHELTQRTQSTMTRYRQAGIRPPLVVQGSVGVHARALGGALLPLHTQFFPNKDIFLK